MQSKQSQRKRIQTFMNRISSVKSLETQQIQSGFLQQISQFIHLIEVMSCPICYETYTEKNIPMTLCRFEGNIQHNICNKCFLKLQSKCCPLCRKKLTGDVSYNIDFASWFQLSIKLKLNITSIKFQSLIKYLNNFLDFDPNSKKFNKINLQNNMLKQQVNSLKKQNAKILQTFKEKQVQLQSIFKLQLDKLRTELKQSKRDNNRLIQQIRQFQQKKQKMKRKYSSKSTQRTQNEQQSKKMHKIVLPLIKDRKNNRVFINFKDLNFNINNQEAQCLQNIQNRKNYQQKQNIINQLQSKIRKPKTHRQKCREDFNRRQYQQGKTQKIQNQVLKNEYNKNTLMFYNNDIKFLLLANCLIF